jgi:predicted GIY-YIG superfamily endonuclease
MKGNNNMKTNEVYLLHFSRPFRHAKHYLGSAVDVRERVAAHRSNQCDVKLLNAAKSVGITFTIARTWAGDRKRERRMKGRGLSRLCPICRRKEAHESSAIVEGVACAAVA